MDTIISVNKILGQFINNNIFNNTLIYRNGSKLIKKIKNESGIHIKKKNRGKFTKSAKAVGESVQEHAHKVVNNPNATTLLKKRAQFAINAKKWKH